MIFASVEGSGFRLVEYFSQNNRRSGESNVGAKTGQAISDYYMILSKNGQDQLENMRQTVFSKLGV